MTAPIKDPNQNMTLTKFIFAEELKHEKITGEFTELLSSLQIIAKSISSMIRRCGLTDPYSTPEKQKDPKIIQMKAHEIFVSSLTETGSVGIIGSECSPKIIEVDKYTKGKYIVMIDPLNGLGNVDVGLTAGSIFGIMLRIDSRKPSIDDALNAQNKMVAAGYMLYGSATLFVLSLGDGVLEFVLDPQIGEFFLVEKGVKILEKGVCYSVNEGYVALWDDAIKEYVKDKKGSDKKKSMRSRYVGSIVADAHRTLKHGGIFMYPGNKEQPQGKLKLLYVCKPMAFVITQAGGLASDGANNILDIPPQNIHQKSPIFIGSPGDVTEILDYIQKNRK